MSNYVITIARQYGSGGRTIGGMIAEKLGIAFYDKDIIQRASEESGVSVDLFSAVDEHSGFVKGGRLFGKAKGLYTGEVLSPTSKEYISDDNLFSLQAQTIKNLAAKESCVMIGRCSNFILRDHPNVIRVFVHADDSFRLEKASEKLSLSEKEIEKFLVKDDKRKEDLSLRYTGKTWTDATQYDLCLDASRLGYEKCVEDIIAFLKVRYPDQEL